METIELILRQTGVITERVVRERDLDAGPVVLEALTSNLTRTMRNVIALPDWGKVHANAGLSDTVWSVQITQIPLHARFQLINQVLVPLFASTTEVEMPLVWQAPADVRLAFVVQTEPDENGMVLDGNWLFAIDRNRRAYRLPLPNLHDDCRICTGEFPSRYATAAECLAASLEQFRKSKWNADLMRTVDRSQKFFRFRPTNEKFETMPIDAADWTGLCDKVSTAISERIVL